MGEEKKEGVLEKNAHKFALGGQLVAVLSILFLVPVVRKLRGQQEHKRDKLHAIQKIRRPRKARRHFAILGH